MKEATARIKINKLLEAAGWRFFREGMRCLRGEYLRTGMFNSDLSTGTVEQMCDRDSWSPNKTEIRANLACLWACAGTVTSPILAVMQRVG